MQRRSGAGSRCLLDLGSVPVNAVASAAVCRGCSRASLTPEAWPPGGSTDRVLACAARHAESGTKLGGTAAFAARRVPGAELAVQTVPWRRRHRCALSCRCPPAAAAESAAAAARSIARLARRRTSAQVRQRLRPSVVDAGGRAVLAAPVRWPVRSSSGPAVVRGSGAGAWPVVFVCPSGHDLLDRWRSLRQPRPSRPCLFGNPDRGRVLRAWRSEPLRAVVCNPALR